MSNVGAETESVTHGHAQRFVLPLKGTELLPKTNILVDVLSGDTLSQSFVTKLARKLGTLVPRGKRHNAF